jgi:uncharacterized protein involved in response to NO
MSTEPDTVLFRIGMRPFFLGAGIYAALALLAWVAWHALAWWGSPPGKLPFAMAPVALHAHEMVFGFAPAVLAGFLLTAVPNWTATRPLSGAPVAALAGLWLAGRLALWTSAALPPVAVALVDVAFPATLAAIVAVPLVRARNRRNMGFPVLLGLLAVASGLAHLEFLGVLAGGAARGNTLAIDVLVLIVAVVGGRVVPAFTRNWLRAKGIAAPVATRPALDVATLTATVGVVALDQVPGAGLAAGWCAAAAALLHLLRLGGWQGWRTLGSPIMWILHLAYLWLAVGFACRAMALLTGVPDPTAALHAFTAGAIGSMTLGVMTRAALGHTGRPLRVPPAIAAAYALVSLGAALRVAGPALLPGFYAAEIMASGLAWGAGFVLFGAVYWPILTRPRVDGVPG